LSDGSFEDKRKAKKVEKSSKHRLNRYEGEAMKRIFEDMEDT